MAMSNVDDNTTNGGLALIYRTPDKLHSYSSICVQCIVLTT